MYSLMPLEQLEIFVLMDNISDPFTKNDKGVYWNESQYRYGVRKQQKVCGADYCRACNGLSLLIKAHVAGATHTVLFDTGPDSGLVVENAKRLNVDLTQIDAIVLSHGHFDHYGGTLSVLNAIGKKDLPVYAHPELFLPRAYGKEELVYVSDLLTPEKIEKQGGKVITSSQPIPFLDNTFLLSGEVPRLTAYEVGFPDEFRLKDNHWECAPEVLDERSLIFSLKNQGLCVITGCGHMGIINATQHAKMLLNTNKVHLVMGGFHLASSDLAERVEPTIADLQAINPDFIVTGHCTGRQTQAVLSKIFSNRHIPYGVGAVFKFK